MSKTSFLSANAMRSVVTSCAQTTNKHFSWHHTKPAVYAAFYAGYEATWGSNR